MSAEAPPKLWTRVAERYDSITEPTHSGGRTKVGDYSESTDFYAAVAIHTGLAARDVEAYIDNLKAQIARQIADDPSTAGAIIEGTLNCALLYGWLLHDELQKQKEGGGRALRPRAHLRRHRRPAARRRPQVLSGVRNRPGCSRGGRVMPRLEDFSPALQRALVRQQEVINAIAGAPAGSADVVFAGAPTPQAYAIHVGEPADHLKSLGLTMAYGSRLLGPVESRDAAVAASFLDGLALGYFLAQEQEASK